MSKGLGTTQRAVLDSLAAHGGDCGTRTLAYLVYHRDAFVFDGEFCPHADWPRNVDITRAEYVAVMRALKTLNGKGLVTLTRHDCSTYGGAHETQHIDLEGEPYTVTHPGGITHYTMACLSVDFVDTLKRSQHLTA